jgi:ankyrin repeat protein
MIYYFSGSDGRKYSRLCSQVMAQLYPEINSSPASVDSSLPDYLSDRVLQMEPMHDWFETQDHGVILVVDPAGAGSNLVASKLNLSLRTNGEQVFSYEIGERDGDNASMRALFFSLCQQALQTLPVSKHASRLCSWVLEGGSVSKEALRGLLCSLLSSNSSSRIYCIIRELNRLTPASQTALLHDLEIIRSHAQRPFKLFLTSETIGNWDQMEPPYKVVHFDQEVLPELEIMRFTKTRLANLVRRVPVWDRVIKDLDMAEKLCIESDTIFEVAQKLDFLESCSFPETIQAVEKVVARLPARLQDLHQVIIDDVHRDSPIGLSAMYWITNSKRSLTLAELAVCGALEKCTKNGMDLGTLVKNISWNPEADLRRSLGPICQVVNNRVKVRHRIYFDLAETGNTSTIPKDVHLHLLIQCIDYQSLAFDHLRNGKIDTKTGKHEAKFCFIEYSVLHWPHHYLNSKDKEQAKSKTVSFLEDSETFRLWLEAYELYTRREYEDGKEDAKEDGKAPRSPLELACYFGLVEVMDHFLEQSAVPNLPPQSYQTAMEFAAERGHAEIVERLVNRTTVAPGVLHLAARGNHLECIKVLITAGANPNEFHCFEYNSLLEAARRGYVDGVDTMIENQADCNTVSKTLMLSALQLASRLGNADLVQRLLDSGASLTSTDNTGYDALKYAAEGGFHRVVEVLLNHSFTVMTNRTEDIVGTSSCERIDMDAKAKCGNTAIHLAAAGGHSAVVQLLLTKNAKLGLMNNDGHTPLHVACQAGFVGVVEQLISVVSNSQANEDNPSEKRPIPDEENSGPSEATALSPIELAVKCQHLQVVKLLLRPNLVVTRDSSFKALFLACQLGYVDIAEALFQLYQNRAYLKDDDSDQDGDGNTALHIAAKYGKVEIMDMILTQEYVPIDYLNKQRETALHLAAEAGHVNVCDTLLRQGASTTIVASDHTPIHYAAKAGHVPAVKILLQHSPTKADGPLLHLAVTQGSEEMTRAIIASSNSGTVPVLDWKNDDGDTAVHVAIHNLHAHLIPVLNEAGVDMGITNNNRETPFFLAVEAGELDAVEQLFATGADIKLDEPNNAGISPLMMMCMELDYQGVGSRIEMSKRVDPLRAILKSDKKVLVDRKHPKTGRTALHYSTDLGKPDELALSLLAAHADPNIQNSRGSTPLFLAAEVGRLNIVEALLNAGAKAAITNNSNSTPLHRAAQNDHAPCIEALVKAGADKDYESNHGYTPLGLAAARGMEEAVEALIRLGASLPLAIRDVIRGDDEIAAKSLWVKRDSETVGRLNQPHMRWGSMLGLAVAQGSNEMVNMLLEEHELDLNVVDAFERTPVMIATIHDTGSESLVGTLLDKGADPNTRDIEGKSPLVRALMADHFRNVEKLLNCGKIDITLPDSRGHTAMYWASRSAESPEGKAAFDKIMAKIEALEEGPKHTSIVEDAIHGSVASGNKWALEKLLAIPDININHADHDGWTALRMAQSYGHDELSKVLIEHGAELEPNGQKPPLPSKWHLVDKSPALSVQSPLSRVVEVKGKLKLPITAIGS